MGRRKPDKKKLEMVDTCKYSSRFDRRMRPKDYLQLGKITEKECVEQVGMDESSERAGGSR